MTDDPRIEAVAQKLFELCGSDYKYVTCQYLARRLVPAADVAEWRPVSEAPKDTTVWAWGDNWHWRRVEKAYLHSDYNGHKDVVTRDGPAGAAFRIGDADAPTHFRHITPPQEDTE